MDMAGACALNFVPAAARRYGLFFSPKPTSLLRRAGGAPAASAPRKSIEVAPCVFLRTKNSILPERTPGGRPPSVLRPPLVLVVNSISPPRAALPPQALKLRCVSCCQRGVCGVYVSVPVWHENRLAVASALAGRGTQPRLQSSASCGLEWWAKARASSCVLRHTACARAQISDGGSAFGKTQRMCARQRLHPRLRGSLSGQHGSAHLSAMGLAWHDAHRYAYNFSTAYTIFLGAQRSCHGVELEWNLVRMWITQALR